MTTLNPFNCPRCKEETSPRFNFCGSCGYALILANTWAWSCTVIFGSWLVLFSLAVTLVYTTSDAKLLRPLTLDVLHSAKALPYLPIYFVVAILIYVICLALSRLTCIGPTVYASSMTSPTQGPNSELLAPKLLQLSPHGANEDAELPGSAEPAETQMIRLEESALVPLVRKLLLPSLGIIVKSSIVLVFLMFLRPFYHGVKAGDSAGGAFFFALCFFSIRLSCPSVPCPPGSSLLSSEYCSVRWELLQSFGQNF